jgi:hypothetical protein
VDESRARFASRVKYRFALVTVALASCAPPASVTVGAATIDFAPLRISVDDAGGKRVFTIEGVQEASDLYFEEPQILPGWDGYRENIDKWRLAKPTNLTSDGERALVTLGGGVDGSIAIVNDGERTRVSFDVKPSVDGEEQKTSIVFHIDDDEGFFGMGERYAEVNHRGVGLYSWAEEGGLGGGEDPLLAKGSPYPNGPSMTYFPVPFYLSSTGYGLHVDTTVRSEVHFGDESDRHGRIAVSAGKFDLVVYAAKPLDALALYTADTGRAPIPAPWVWDRDAESTSTTTPSGSACATLTSRPRESTTRCTSCRTSRRSDARTTSKPGPSACTTRASRSWPTTIPTSRCRIPRRRRTFSSARRTASFSSTRKVTSAPRSSSRASRRRSRPWT